MSYPFVLMFLMVPIGPIPHSSIIIPISLLVTLPFSPMPWLGFPYCLTSGGPTSVDISSFSPEARYGGSVPWFELFSA